MSRLNKTLTLFVLFLLPALTQAKSSDADQPLHIEADTVEIKEKEGISIYRGNVKIDKGSMVITGDLIFVHSIGNQLQTIRVEGQPATFKQLNDADEEISAQGHKIKYVYKTGILNVDENAILVQKDNRFTSEHIVYDTQKDIVQAGSNGNTSSEEKPTRVTITIQPEKKKE